MPLSADISVKLNADTIVQALLTTLAPQAAQLTSISPPANGDRINATVSATVQINTGPVGDSVSHAAQAITGQLAQLPGVGDVLREITTALEAVEQVTNGDIAADIQALIGRISTELQSGGDGGFVSVLLRISEIVSQAPQGQVLASLLSVLTGGASGSLTLPNELKDALPAFVTTVRVIAGLMTLESALGESERLARLMSGRITGTALKHEMDALLAAFNAGPSTLAQRAAAVDPTDPVAVKGLIAAFTAAAAQAERLDSYASEGMGFGEATLTYLDVTRIQTEIAAANALLRGADLQPLGRVIQGAVHGIEPLLQLDAAQTPQFTLDSLLAQAEGQVAQVASQIAAFDSGALVQPLVGGIQQVTGIVRGFSDVISRVTTAIRAALNQVRDLVAAIPIQDIANAIRHVLEPLTQALQAIQSLVDEIKAALQTAADHAVQVIGQIDGAVDAFQTQVKALFDQARQFVDGLHLDQIAGEINGKVRDFTQLLSKAEMKPYFDTATNVIGSTADVIGKIPFALLPESMKTEVDNAVAPIRNTDVAQVEADIKQLLAIGPDGHFALRPDLEQALQEIQTKYDQLIATLEQHNPRQYLQQIDRELTQIGARIQAIMPDLSLQPIHEAIDRVRNAIGSFDLDAQLQPLQAIFTQINEAIDRYSPSRLLDPVEQRIRAARERLIALIHLNDWEPALDQLAGRATDLLNLIDPAKLEGVLTGALAEIQALIPNAPNVRAGSWLGSIIAGLLRGANLRIYPNSFEAVLGWTSAGPGSGASALAARTARIAVLLGGTKQAVQDADFAALATAVSAQLAALRPSVTTLSASLGADSPLKLDLDVAIGRLSLEPMIARLATNRGRYLASLGSAASLAEDLRRTGFSEADQAVSGLRDAFAPVRAVSDRFKRILQRLGITGFDDGLNGVLRNLFAAASPARLAHVASPIFVALQARLQTLLTAILNPIKSGIADLRTLIGQFDLAPLQQSIDGIVNEVKAQINALNPLVLLKGPLDAFKSLQHDVASFDPLAPLTTVLNALRDLVPRVIAKLSAEKLLQAPLAIYQTIVDALKALNIQTLMGPVLDQIDRIAEQVNQGLDSTVGAFQRLQQALPSGGGGSVLSVAVSITGSLDVGL